jgi:KDO2-lipid IV(A) lauroyltransferase
MVVGESPLKDAYRRVVWGPWRQLLERLPEGWDYRANRRMGRAAGRVSAGKRGEVVEALRRAFPDRGDLDALAVEAFGTHFVNQYASFAFGRLDARNWERWLAMEGLEHLDRAAADGMGVVLLHPHMGPAQLPLAALGAMGRDVHQIGGGDVEVQKSAVGEWASAERSRLERRMRVTLHDGGGYLRAVLRVLGRGGIVLTACDGTGGGKELGRRLVRPVLGRPMQLPVGAFWLAYRSGARVHPLYTVRDGGDPRRHRSVIGPEVPVDRGGTLPAALEAGADFTAGWLSLLLARYPGDWLFWDAFRPGMLLVDGP